MCMLIYIYIYININEFSNRKNSIQQKIKFTLVCSRNFLLIKWKEENWIYYKKTSHNCVIIINHCVIIINHCVIIIINNCVILINNCVFFACAFFFWTNERKKLCILRFPALTVLFLPYCSDFPNIHYNYYITPTKILTTAQQVLSFNLN